MGGLFWCVYVPGMCWCYSFSAGFMLEGTMMDGMHGAVGGVPASGAADSTVGGMVSGAARGVVTDACIGAVEGNG